MEQGSIPQHVAVIMDGNGRWARQRNKSRSYGHLKGLERIDEIVEVAQKTGVKVLTLFAFSSENWLRPRQEVKMLMNALVANLPKKIKKLSQAGIRFQVIGRQEGVPPTVWKTLEKAQQMTKQNDRMILNLAFNYGARQEIIDAVRKIAENVDKGVLKPSMINESIFSEALYTRGLPDPDLLIRTSGEKRISNFLLWQLSYGEFYFTSKHWPEFDQKEFLKALEDFKNRERRYGAVGKTKR